MLSIEKALKLAKIMRNYIPDEVDTDVLHFVSIIVKNILNGESPSDYFAAIILTSGKTSDELKQLEPDKVLDLFVRGLLENNINELVKFYRRLSA